MEQKIDQALRNLRQGAAPTVTLTRVKEDVMTKVAQLPFHRGHTPIFFAFIGVCAVVFMSFGGTVWAAQGAQPGDTLYSVKRGSEHVWVTTQLSPDGKMHAARVIMERRYNEAANSDQPSEYAVVEYKKAADHAMGMLEAYATPENSAMFEIEAQRIAQALERHANSADEMFGDNDDLANEFDQEYSDCIARIQNAMMTIESQRQEAIFSNMGM